MTVKTFLAAHTVTIVPGLAAARDALCRERFDVLLVDYDLDDGKGSDLVTELAGVPGRPFVMAVSARERGNEELLRAGADAVCGKMNFGEIEAVLSQLQGSIRLR